MINTIALIAIITTTNCIGIKCEPPVTELKTLEEFVTYDQCIEKRNASIVPFLQGKMPNNIQMFLDCYEVSKL